MYTGTNPSALRSQEWIANALLSLMNQKTFASITIKELCAEADLSRQTFYQFFESKEDVLRYVLLKYYTFFEQELLEKEILNLEILSAAFFHFFRKHEDLVKLLIDHHVDYILTEQFSLVLPKIMTLCVDDQSTLISNSHINSFIVGGLSAMIIDWIKNGSATGEEELTKLFLQLFNR